MSVLVIDVGTSGLRAGVVDGAGDLHHLHHQALLPVSPFPGLVEFDAVAMADAALEVADAALADFGAPIAAVGICNQRASTVVWDRATGSPVGPGIGWQDLRTVFDCITLKADHDLTLAPNQSATKVRWLLDQFDADRQADLCFGTVETWLAWVLSEGSAHVTDRSNAAVTGLLRPDASSWSAEVLEVLRVPAAMMPELVDTTGICATASRLRGRPPIAALVGDQQASLIGQSCVRPGQAKITFGTGGMLDVCLDTRPPTSARRSPNGSFPIVAWSRDGEVTWGAEGVMLSAGTNVEWLVDDLGLLRAPAESHEVAARCTTTGGVVYVPALLGLGTPQWDYGARGGLFGMTRGTGRPEIVRAVLEGVAQRGADLVEATEADTGTSIAVLRIDGGMSENPTFVQAVANAAQRPVEIARYADSTTVGAGYLAGLAGGVWADIDAIHDLWRPAARVEPNAALDRDAWREAVHRVGGWIPDLSALDF